MDNKAVSPVIGVILMVAITVILAATVGTFVLGTTDGIGETSPQVSVSVEDVDTATDTITIKHNGGEEFTQDNTEEIRVLVEGSQEASLTGSSVEFSAGEEKEITAGNSGVVDDDTITVVWVGTDQSSIIAEGEA